MASGRKESRAQDGLAAVGIATLAIACCAALPLLAAVAGAVAIGTVLGIGAGGVALVVLITLVVRRMRRRVAPPEFPR